MNKQITLLILGFLLLVSGGLAFAQPVIVGNTISNATIPYQFLTEKYSVNVTDANTITSVTFTWNGISNTIDAPANTFNGIFNYTAPAYNSIGNVIVTANVLDSANTFTFLTENVYYHQYLLPTVANVVPTVVGANTAITYGVSVTPGSFPVNDIVWGFLGHYFTNVAYNGTNYQSYNLGSAGTYTVSAQVCDIHKFCSSASQSIRVEGTSLNSYWALEGAKVIGTKLGTYDGIPIYGLQSPNRAQIVATFHPENDTNPIATVTINWGDGGAAQQTVYNDGVTQDTYYHNYPSLGNFTVTMTICDTIGNCNTTKVLYYLYQSTFVGALSQTLLNTQPTSTTASSALGAWWSSLGTTLAGAITEILIVLVVLMFGGMFAVLFGLSYLKKHKII